MMDIWMTLGTLVADPRLDAAIVAAGPGFDRIECRIHWVDEPTPRIPSASGAFLEDATNRVRNVINGFFRQEYPAFELTASAYCAAKMCHLYLHNPLPAGLVTLCRNLIARYNPVLSRGFLTLLGLILIDGEARVRVDGGGAQQLAYQFYSALSPEQGEVLKQIARALLDPTSSGIPDPLRGPIWDSGCLQVFFFYPGFARATV